MSEPLSQSASGADPRPRYKPQELEQFMVRVFEKHGMPAADAGLAARILLDADLSGVESHGMANFPTHQHYAVGLAKGDIAKVASPKVLRETPVSAAWDAQRGFGLVVAHRAMQTAIEKAASTGIGMVTVRAGMHFGAAGYFARMAAEHDMIGMVACHGSARALPPGGSEPVFGTNPLAMAAPVEGSHPFVMDICPTVVAASKLKSAHRQGREVPVGWVVNPDGTPSTDPMIYYKGGHLLALGAGSGAEHKGYALGLMVDILSGMMSGTGSGMFLPQPPKHFIHQGQWFAAWRLDLFLDPAEFKKQMRRAFDTIRAKRPRPGVESVLVPGDHSHATRQHRAAHGIPLEEETITLCTAMGESTGVPFPRPL